MPLPNQHHHRPNNQLACYLSPSTTATPSSLTFLQCQHLQPRCITLLDCNIWFCWCQYECINFNALQSHPLGDIFGNTNQQHPKGYRQKVNGVENHHSSRLCQHRLRPWSGSQAEEGAGFRSVSGFIRNHAGERGLAQGPVIPKETKLSSSVNHTAIRVISSIITEIEWGCSS